MTFGSDGDPNKGSLSQCHGINDPFPAYRFRFTPVGTSPFSTPRCQKGSDPAPQVSRLCKNGGIRLVHVHNRMNMNRRALAWPRPSHNLTFQDGLFSRPTGSVEPDAPEEIRESPACPHLKQRLFVGQHPEALQTLHTQAPGIAEPPRNRPCMTTGIGLPESMFLT